MASRPAVDAWYGARDWALEQLPSGEAGTEGWISRQDYEEKGGEYLSEHGASNMFVSMKIAKPAPPIPRPAEPTVSAALGETLTTSVPAAVTPGVPPLPSASVPATVAVDVQMAMS